MQDTELFIRTFSILGEFLSQFPEGKKSRSERVVALNKRHYAPFKTLISRQHIYNPWFTEGFILDALKGIGLMLDEEVLRKWLNTYEIPSAESIHPKRVGLVLAGNIPLAGFHDLLCVMASGHRILAKPSTKDDHLLRELAVVLFSLEPSLEERLEFTDEKMENLDAVIATGSDNSARYFEYYFRNIPHIIRKNRNGVAVLTGKESPQQLDGLGRDVFTYFGLGCRNVTKLYIPKEFDLKRLLSRWESYTWLGQHHRYANNVEYYRTIYLMNRVPVLDNGVILMKEDPAIASPVGVVFYERYSEIEMLGKELELHAGEIQCCVSISPGIKEALAPGSTQVPLPWDYADRIDAMRFLLELR